MRTNGNETRSLIVAEAKTSQVTATARGTWPKTPPQPQTESAVNNVVATETTPPAPRAKSAGSLAETGASLLTPGLAGLALVSLGIVVLLVRRRHRRHT